MVDEGIPVFTVSVYISSGFDMEHLECLMETLIMLLFYDFYFEGFSEAW